MRPCVWVFNKTCYSVCEFSAATVFLSGGLRMEEAQIGTWRGGRARQMEVCGVCDGPVGRVRQAALRLPWQLTVHDTYPSSSHASQRVQLALS